jgi:nucleoside-diphosphate-sugar epimerase
MRILITGIQGQDGSILAEKHLGKGDEVWGTASSRNLAGRAGYELLRAPLESLEESTRVFDEIKPERIYHLAAKHFASTNHGSLNLDVMSEMHDCHVQITRNILEWQVSNSSCKSLIALSSQMYTPMARSQVINEESQCNPQNYYASTKFEAMKLLQFYRKNYHVRTYGAILFNHTSARSRPDFLFPYLAREIANIIKGTSTEISLSDPNAMIDICDADEVCEGLYNLLCYEKACDVVFSSGKLVALTDLITNTMQILNFQGNYTVTKSGNRKINQESLVGDPSLAAKLINWKVKLRPEEIMVKQVLKAVNN